MNLNIELEHAKNWQFRLVEKAQCQTSNLVIGVGKGGMLPEMERMGHVCPCDYSVSLSQYSTNVLSTIIISVLLNVYQNISHKNILYHQLNVKCI